MRIAVIAHGGLPIPVAGWGAVEGLIWRRAVRLRALGHSVDIYNDKRIEQVIAAIDEQTYDFVHCHNDGFARELNKSLQQPYVLTNHHGDLHQLVTRPATEASYRDRLQGCLGAPGNIALSPLIGDYYLRHGYSGFLQALPNTVEVDWFRFAPAGERDAICLGQVTRRKRQARLAALTKGRVPIDFVGGWKRDRVPEFEESTTARYLGSWNREMIQERLTEYRCLVLLSKSEAAPVVVLEALADRQRHAPR